MSGPDTVDACSFCGKGRHEVARLLRPSERTRLAGPVAICSECIELCNQVLAHGGKPVYFEVVAPWTPFEVDGHDLDWSADRCIMDGEPVLMVHVRNPGEPKGGIGRVYPVDTEPTDEHARDTARIWLNSKQSD
jgi:hypothetical protein